MNTVCEITLQMASAVFLTRLVVSVTVPLGTCANKSRNHGGQASALGIYLHGVHLLVQDDALVDLNSCKATYSWLVFSFALDRVPIIVVYGCRKYCSAFILCIHIVKHSECSWTLGLAISI